MAKKALRGAAKPGAIEREGGGIESEPVVRITMNIPISIEERIHLAQRQRASGIDKYGKRNRTATSVVLEILDEHLPTLS